MMNAPKEPKDLALAPVAVAIDRNLQTLRIRTPEAISLEIAIALDMNGLAADPQARAAQVRDYATRFVDLHGWSAEPTDDFSAIRLSGGSVTLDVAVGAAVMQAIAQGVPTPA